MSDEATGDQAAPAEPVIDPELLAMLVCPACHGELLLVGQRLECQGCGLKYRIEDGIPIMLIDQAER
jgi:uncharacterized protein YbaR (Trm112 family)